MTLSKETYVNQYWAQHSEEELINVPIYILWELMLDLNLEEITDNSTRVVVPKVETISAVIGNFTEEGHRRRIYFANGQSFLQTIITMDTPSLILYELTELKLKLKPLIYCARGLLRFSATTDNKTKLEWTYAFEQKNFIAKWLLNTYIRQKHQYWMKDTLLAIKRQCESRYML